MSLLTLAHQLGSSWSQNARSAVCPIEYLPEQKSADQRTMELTQHFLNSVRYNRMQFTMKVCNLFCRVNEQTASFFFSFARRFCRANAKTPKKIVPPTLYFGVMVRFT